MWDSKESITSIHEVAHRAFDFAFGLNNFISPSFSRHSTVLQILLYEHGKSLAIKRISYHKTVLFPYKSQLSLNTHFFGGLFCMSFFLP